MLYSLTHGQSTGVGLYCQHLHLCLRPACRNTLWGATHRPMTNPWGSQMQRHLGSASLLNGILLSWFENNWRQCKHWLPSVSVWFAGYSCTYWKVHTITHILIFSIFPPRVPLFRVAQRWSLICLSQATIPLLFLTWGILQAGTV